MSCFFLPGLGRKEVSSHAGFRAVWSNMGMTFSTKIITWLSIHAQSNTVAYKYPCSTELLVHPSLVGSKVYFFWSPTEDYCVTVWWIWFVFVDYQVSVWSALSSVIGTFLPDQITPDTLGTDLIVDKHKSDSSDCDTIVFRRWPEEINFASNEWRMS